MTRLEKYKSWLIPVDDVVYVAYRKSDRNEMLDDDFLGGTIVYIATNHSGILTSIRIGKRNCIDDFKKWFDSISNKAVDVCEENKSENPGEYDMTINNPFYPKECPYQNPIHVKIVPASIKGSETNGSNLDKN